MKKYFSFFISLVIMVVCFPPRLYAQEGQTFYITNTTYEAFQVDKVPFAMKKITLSGNDDSLNMAEKTFYRTALKDGSFIYLTADRKSYLLIIDKTEQVGFIVSPNGKDWSCYFKYKKGSKIPPPDYSNDEASMLKEALGKITDPRERYCYLTYSSFSSSGVTDFVKDSLPVIINSPDTITAGGYYFYKKTDNLYKSKNGTYLFMPDKETFIFRDPDVSDWASFYQKDANKANRLISQEYKSEKELRNTNTAIAEMENLKTRKIVNSYFSGTRSNKNDPTLTNAILKYWNGRWPGSQAYAVVFGDNDFHIARNNLGVALRRSITAWVIYKENGKCYAKWHEYGYEATGGGSFAKEISQWLMNKIDHAIEANTSAGSLNLFSGYSYELDCTIIK